MIEALKQWAVTLVITAVVGSIAMSFTVSENGKNMKKYVKFACSLVALAVMISPIRGLFQDFPSLFGLINSNGTITQNENDNFNNYEDAGVTQKINDLIIAKTSELLKDRISAAIIQKTGIKPENIYIYIKQNDITDSTEISGEVDIDITKAEIYMPENTTENDLKKIELYLKELLKCDISVNIADTSEEKNNEQ